jgi:uncharacterized membrane protein YeaQ/YmgE (transglycosylase-associated protein family)
MGTLAWIVIGGLAGWIASHIAGRSKSLGLIGNIVIGILGALIGGFLVNVISGNPVDFSFSFQSLLVAIFGSIVLLTLINLFKGK